MRIATDLNSMSGTCLKELPIEYGLHARCENAGALGIRLTRRLLKVTTNSGEDGSAVTSYQHWERLESVVQLYSFLTSEVECTSLQLRQRFVDLLGFHPQNFPISTFHIQGIFVSPILNM
jgi:hypothetical protein